VKSYILSQLQYRLDASGRRNKLEFWNTMKKLIRLGISTCPNDTFAFHGLMTRSVDWRGLDFSVELLDVEELNQRLFVGKFDVAKASFHAALLLSRKFVVLPSGSALGFGVGPLLLSCHKDIRPDSWNKTRSPVVLCPGAMTTATMLFKLFFPDVGDIQHVVFSDIMPRLKNQTADFGVCIHEGRFTWQQSGLFMAADLGDLWESQTGKPLPLGGILGARVLGDEILATVQQVIHDSLEYARAHPDKALDTMRRYAQELSDDILMHHVELYVNDQTLELTSVGREAIGKLSELAIEKGLIDADQPGLEILDSAC
jgi:1,4-dihydroxy-6-naphthoate synthase